MPYLILLARVVGATIGLAIAGYRWMRWGVREAHYIATGWDYPWGWSALAASAVLLVTMPMWLTEAIEWIYSDPAGFSSREIFTAADYNREMQSVIGGINAIHAMYPGDSLKTTRAVMDTISWQYATSPAGAPP